MWLDEAALDEYTDRFDHDAFRHEMLDRYDVPSDGGDLARYLAGEPGPDPAVTEPWGGWVRRQVARGATVRRLRTLAGPPGDYLRWEMEWVYTANVEAGEDIRILDLAERRPEHPLAVEFWMLDHQRVALMNYDLDGRFVNAHAQEGPLARVLREKRDAAWELAEPFTSWWARRPDLHRASA